MFAFNEIQYRGSLKLLEKEGLVLIKQMDTLIILLLFLVFKKLSLLI
jgi:hypothetical protein